MSAPWTPEFLAISQRPIGEILDAARARVLTNDPSAGPALDRTRGVAEETARRVVDGLLTAQHGVGLPVSIGDRLEVGHRGAMRLGTVMRFGTKNPEWAWVEFDLKSGRSGDWAHVGMLGLRPRRTDAAPRNPLSGNVTRAAVEDYLDDHDQEDPTFQEAAWAVCREHIRDLVEGTDNDLFLAATGIAGSWIAAAGLRVEHDSVGEAIEWVLGQAVDDIAVDLDRDHIFNTRFRFDAPLIDPLGKVRKVGPVKVTMPFARVEYQTRESGAMWFNQADVNLYRSSAVRYPEVAS